MNNLVTLLNRNWFPATGVSELQRQIDDLFDDVLGTSTRGWVEAAGSYVPTAEVEETDGHYFVSMDVPGVSKDGIQIELKEGSLRVVAERKATSARKGSERRYGKWERHFTLPQGIDVDHVEASLEDGVLRIAIPRAETAKPRLVKIQEGKSGLFQRLLSGAKKDDASKAEITVQPEKSA